MAMADEVKRLGCGETLHETTRLDDKGNEERIQRYRYPRGCRGQVGIGSAQFLHHTRSSQGDEARAPRSIGKPRSRSPLSPFPSL